MNRRKELREFFRTQMEEGHLIDKVDDAQSLIDAGLLDSLSVLILMCHLTERYGLMLDEADIDVTRFETVARLDQFIGQRCGAQANPTGGGSDGVDLRL